MPTAFPLLFGLSLPAAPVALRLRLPTCARSPSKWFCSHRALRRSHHAVRALWKRHSPKGALPQFGQTPQGRPMLALGGVRRWYVFPSDIAQKSRPWSLAQGCIHAGEVDGKTPVLAAAEPAVQRNTARRAQQADVCFRPGFQRRWPRTFRRPPATQPERTRRNRLARRSPQLELKPRLRQSRNPEMLAMLGLFAALRSAAAHRPASPTALTFSPMSRCRLNPGSAARPCAQLAVICRSGFSMSCAARSHAARLYPTFVKKTIRPRGFVKSTAAAFSTGYWPRKIASPCSSETTRGNRSRAPRPCHPITPFRPCCENVAEHGKDWRMTAQQVDHSDEKRPPGSRIPLGCKPAQTSRTRLSPVTPQDRAIAGIRGAAHRLRPTKPAGLEDSVFPPSSETSIPLPAGFSCRAPNTPGGFSDDSAPRVWVDGAR